MKIIGTSLLGSVHDSHVFILLTLKLSL